MKMTRFVVFSIAVLVLVLFANTVQAQKGAVVSFKGIEISSGHEDPGEIYGWMCYAKTTGALPGNFTLSMDYDGVKAPGTTSSITDGNWTLPVYNSSTFGEVRPIRIDSYQGVLFGGVGGGTIVWDKYGTTATVELKMYIRGGTQAMADLKGSAILYGTVTYEEKGTGTFTGTIYFDFQ